MRRRVPLLSLAAGTAALVGSFLPNAGAVSPPVVASENIEVVASFPDVSAISTAFATDKPLMYVNTLNGVSVYDISNPELPLLKGALPLPHFENEAMALGERPDGTKFVLIGVDIYAVTAQDTARPATVAATAAQHLIVVDVTDPAAPRIRSQLPTGSSTHTVQCVGKECRYAYTSGAYNSGTYHVIDLTNLDSPVQVKALKNIAGEGHQWDADGSGLLWSTGGSGTAAYDVSDPLNPVAVASTNPKGTQSPYNDFIHHNSLRPNADRFTQVRDEATNRLVSGSKQTASVFDGNVVLITEEDYADPTCGAGEGIFQTWYLPYADAAQYAKDNPTKKANAGKMEPLDTWQTELLGTGRDNPAGALCSAHYFTYHQAGFISQAWYQQGTRVLDVRNPRDIKQVGYFFGAASETWHTYFVPEYKNGKQTGQASNLIYTNDAVRGIDVLRITLPTTPPAETDALVAPILDEWRQPAKAAAKASKPSARFGYACRLTA